MITTTCVGGTGNILFQISMLLAFSLKHNLEYCVPLEITYPHSVGQKQFYSKYLNYCNKPNTLPLYLEEGFTYKEIPYMDNVCFQGYWQSFRYTKDYREQIINLLDIPKTNDTNKIFLHYRLGDYKVLGKFHKIISEEYIAKALTDFYEKGYKDIMVFSDEIEIAKQKFQTNETSSNLLNLFNWHYSEGKTEIQDLSLMAACSGGIMSPSSFSYWGAWLGNQDRLIFYPSEWFGSEYKLTHSIADLCPPNWQAL